MTHIDGLKVRALFAFDHLLSKTLRGANEPAEEGEGIIHACWQLR